MRVVIEQWKYIIKNLWFVLPFAVVPAVFLSLSVDFEAVAVVAKSLFAGGAFELEFSQIFRAWSFFRTDSFVGILYSIFAVVCLIFFSALLLSFVEKHMRIGKRSFSGIMAQMENHIFVYIGFVVFLLVCYEILVLVLSAVLYVLSHIKSPTAARTLFALLSLAFISALLYLVTIVYLWLPCKQHTGLKTYGAFLYSYSLMVGVRWKLYLSMFMTYMPCFLVLFGSVFGPLWISRILAIILFACAYLSFCVRMETLYFETDQIDREDLLRSYMEL